MSILSAIEDRLDRSFRLYRDLVESIDGGHLGSKLPGLPSNTVGSQLWCVVGARESYARAIGEDGWGGFSCSLVTVTEKAQVADALHRSAGRCCMPWARSGRRLPFRGGLCSTCWSTRPPTRDN